MVCLTCGLDNDPSAAACVRCNTSLAPTAAAPGVAGSAPAPGMTWAPPVSGGSPPRGRSPLVLVSLAVVVLVAAVTVGLVQYRRGADGDPGTALDVGGTQVTDPQTAPPSTTEPTPEPTATVTEGLSERDAAVLIDAVLDESIISRRKLNNAIDRVNRCTGLAGALADMRDVGDERQAQIAAVADADLSTLSNGEELRSTLTAALRNALEADEEFVAWAEPTLSGGCISTGTRRDAYRRARAASTEAQRAKRTFVQVWNPVADAFSLGRRSTDDI